MIQTQTCSTPALHAAGRCMCVAVFWTDTDAAEQAARDRQPAVGATRTCPDCGRPQHYTGLEYGWAHDALVDTWHCADPRKAGA